MGTFMLVIQGVGINSVFIYVRQYFMKGNTFTCNIVYAEIFPRIYQLTYIQNNIPHHLTLIVFSKVLLGSQLNQNIDTLSLSSLGPLKPSALFIPILKLSQRSRGHIPIFPVQEEQVDAFCHTLNRYYGQSTRDTSLYFMVSQFHKDSPLIACASPGEACKSKKTNIGWVAPENRQDFRS